MKLWKYRHFKGTLVDVIGIAKHSETMEDMVVYIHPDPVKWLEWGVMRVRPLAMFLETVMKDGKEIPKFAYMW